MRKLFTLLSVILALAGCGSEGSDSAANRQSSGKRIPVNILRLDGKKIEPGYRFDNGLRIIQPKPGSTFAAGTTIQVLVEPTNNFVPREVWVSSPYEWKDCLAAPYAAELKIPREYLGPLQVCANGQNHDKDIASADAVEVMITPPAKLIGMAFYLEPHVLTPDLIPSRNILVTGKFADGIERRMENSNMPLKFAIENSKIASLEGGKIVYRSPGKTRLTATCEGISISSDVFVAASQPELAAMMPDR